MKVPEDKKKQIEALKRLAGKLEEDTISADDWAVFYKLVKPDEYNIVFNQNVAELRRQRANKCYEKIAELEQEAEEEEEEEEDSPEPQIGDVWQLDSTDIRILGVHRNHLFVKWLNKDVYFSVLFDQQFNDFATLIERPPLKKGQAVYDKISGNTGVVCKVIPDEYYSYNIRIARETEGKRYSRPRDSLIPLTLPHKEKE